MPRLGQTLADCRPGKPRETTGLNKGLAGLGTLGMGSSLRSSTCSPARWVWPSMRTALSLSRSSPPPHNQPWRHDKHQVDYPGNDRDALALAMDGWVLRGRQGGQPYGAVSHAEEHGWFTAWLPWYKRPRRPPSSRCFVHALTINKPPSPPFLVTHLPISFVLIPGPSQLLSASFPPSTTYLS
jgi:hypothetical protein